MNKILELNNISKSYNKGKSNEVLILENFNFSLSAGEIVGLVAPSGAGKSTLLHIAGLLDTPDTGTVHILGHKQTGLSDNKRTKTRREDIGFIYQFHHLLPEFSALENIALPQMANGVSKSVAQNYARDLLNRVGLEHRFTHRPAEMSGGEQQRVAFCRALANQPKLILADEPTGNLDPKTSETVFSTLLDLVHETGLSALVATHNIELAQRMDRILHLNKIIDSY